MKTILLPLTLFTTLMISSHRVHSQCPPRIPLDQSLIPGQWQGACSSGGKFVEFSLELLQADDGLQAALDIPGFNEANSYSTVKVCGGRELHILHMTKNASYEFIGRPHNGKNMPGRVLIYENGELVSEEVFTLQKVKTNL